MKIRNLILVSLLVTGCAKQPAAHTGDGGQSPAIPANQEMERETPAGGDDENTAVMKYFNKIFLKTPGP